MRVIPFSLFLALKRVSSASVCGRGKDGNSKAQAGLAMWGRVGPGIIVWLRAPSPRLEPTACC